MLQLKLQKVTVTSPGSAYSSDNTFDVGINISQVPPFHECEVESNFSAWLRDVWAILLQYKLTGKAQETWRTVWSMIR